MANRTFLKHSCCLSALCFLTTVVVADDNQLDEVVVQASPWGDGGELMFPLENLVVHLAVYRMGAAIAGTVPLIRLYDKTNNENCNTPKKSPSARALINGNEGVGPGGLTQAYVPAGESSGATVGHGVDLSRQSEADIARAGVSAATQAAVAPYLMYKQPVIIVYPTRTIFTWEWHFGPEGNNARNMLVQHPVNMSLPESEALSTMAYNKMIGTVESQIGSTTYEQMPEILQNALADVAYNHGSLTYDMKAAIDTNRWDQLPAAIRAVPRMDIHRANRDAKTVEAAIRDGVIPWSSSKIC